MCTCRGLLPAVHRPRTPSCATARCPTATSPSPTSSFGQGEWDELQIPVGLAFLFRNSVQDRRSRSTRARPAPPSPSCRWTPGTASSRANPQLALLRADVEALLVRRTGPRPRATVQLPRWCRSTPATSWSGGCARCGAGSTAGRRRAPRSTSSSPMVERAQPARPGRRPRRRRHEQLRFTVVDIFAEPYAAAPQLTARLRIEETTGQTIHAIALRCQVRIEPQRRRYDEADEQRAARPVRRPRPLGRHAQAVPVDAVQHHGAGLHRTSPRSTCALPCTYDFEVTGSRYLHARRRRHGPADAAVLRHRVHPGQHRVRGGSRCRGTARRATSCRSRCGSR